MENRPVQSGPENSDIAEPMTPFANCQNVFALGSLPRRLLIVALLFIGAHLALSIYHYKIQEIPWLVLQLFDLDEENNLPTWFSGFILLISTALLWICTRQKIDDRDPWHTRWTVLTVGFLILSIDEIAGVHETLNSAIEMSWAIPGGILALVLGIAFVPFIRSLPRHTSLMLVAAGALYVGGAIGMEFVGDPFESDSFTYYMVTMVEEGMEMLGIILFIRTMIQYMSGDQSDVSSQPVELT